MTPSEKPGRVLKVLSVDESGETKSEWTKQLAEDPFGKAYKHSGIQEPPYPFEQLMMLAEQHPTHSAIIEQKAADIVGTGWRWEADEDEEKSSAGQKDKLEEWFAELANDSETDDTTHEILLSAWDDVETFGQGFIELSRDTSGKLRHWFRTPAHTFRFHRDGLRILQKRGNRQQWFKRWIPEDERLVDASTGKVYDKKSEAPKDVNRANELLVLRRTSRRSSWYGVPKYISTTGWITLSLAARDDNILFFQNHREARWVIVLENVEDDPELEDAIRHALRSDLKSPHRNLVLPLEGNANVTFQKLGTDQNDASWERLQDRVDASILLALRMPGERVGLVRSGPLGGNAVTAATRVYKDGFVTSSQEILSARINKLIAAESGIGNIRWRWEPEELDLTERDAERQSAVQVFTGGITTLDEAREQIGEEPLPDDDERGKKFYFELTKGQPAPPGGLPADQGVLAQQNEELAARIQGLIDKKD